MGFIDRGMTGGYQRANLGSLTTTGANESLRALPPTGLSGPLLQQKFLTERYSLAETWVPVGIVYVITTGITVTAAAVTLRKNGVNALTGGVASLPIQALGPNEVGAAFTPWTFAAADLPGDVWSIFVTTTSTAGVVTANLVYAIRDVINVADGVSI